MKMSPLAYAQLRKERGLPGQSITAVLNALKEGRITAVDGQIEPEEADRQWEANSNPKKQPKIGIPEQPRAELVNETMAQAAARKERMLADLREAERDEKYGELVNAQQVEAAWAEVGAFVLQEVGSIPMRVTNRLPDEWRKEVYKVLTEETRRVLASISDEFIPDTKAA